MLVLELKERAFLEKVNSRCFRCFPAAILGTLSIDNETDDDDASQPRQPGPTVSFSAGKTKFKQGSFPDGRRLFLCEEVCLVTVLLGHSKTSVICIL